MIRYVLWFKPENGQVWHSVNVWPGSTERWAVAQAKAMKSKGYAVRLKRVTETTTDVDL